MFPAKACWHNKFFSEILLTAQNHVVCRNSFYTKQLAVPTIDFSVFLFNVFTFYLMFYQNNFNFLYRIASAIISATHFIFEFIRLNVIIVFQDISEKWKKSLVFCTILKYITADNWYVRTISKKLFFWYWAVNLYTRI